MARLHHLDFTPRWQHRYVDLSFKHFFSALTNTPLAGIGQGPDSFGGAWHTKLYTAILGFGSVGGTLLSVSAARKLEFGRHRVWALRGWGVTTTVCLTFYSLSNAT